MAADIYKGIFVILHMSWFVCPSPEVRLFVGRREYVS